MVRRHIQLNIDVLNDCSRFLVADVLWHDLGTVVTALHPPRESQDTGDRVSLVAGQHGRESSPFFPSRLVFDAHRTACSMQ